MVSVHVADVGARRALRLLRRAPSAGSIDGLRHANVAAAIPFSATSIPRPSLRRAALIGFWDSTEAVERFADSQALADEFADGWRATLQPLRVHGSWPGLPDGIPRGRTTDYDGPAVVLTLGRVRLPRALRFLRTSSPAEHAAVAAPGAIWSSALVRPPFVSTLSLWESVAALSAFAYGQDVAPHRAAIAADRAKPFHHQSAFIRFRPLGVAGSLDGRNPLAAGAFGAAVPSG